MPTQERPVILLITLDLQPWFDKSFKTLIDLISAKATLERAETTAAVKQALFKKPQAVLIPNEAITKRENAPLWDFMLDYVRYGGGTAICMGMFAAFIQLDDFGPFFAKAGLSWDLGHYTRNTSSMKRGNVPQALQPFLSEEYSQKAVHLKGVAPGDSWYEPVVYSDDESPDEDEPRTYTPLPVFVPVAMAKVGDGRLGYVGDVNGENESHLVVVAMCGLLG